MFRQVCTIEPSFIMATGMHRRPFEGQHLVHKWIRLNNLYNLLESFFQILKSFFELTTIFLNNSVGVLMHARRVLAKVISKRSS